MKCQASHRWTICRCDASDQLHVFEVNSMNMLRILGLASDMLVCRCRPSGRSRFSHFLLTFKFDSVCDPKHLH